MQGSLAYFPFVGLIIGAVIAGFDWAAKGVWPATIAGTASVALMAFVTRGLHLDGLADTADAVASGRGREEALEIMRDSTNGALGILAMVIVLVMKSVSAVSISNMSAWQWFVIIPCFSRTGVVVLGAFSSYARTSGGLGSAFTGSGTARYLLLSLPTAAAAAWALCGVSGLSVLAVVIVCSLAVARWAEKKFGGVTGDVLGAHVELIEMFLFLSAAAILHATR